jgi:predicted alpha/beta-fold hydrolase
MTAPRRGSGGYRAPGWLPGPHLQTIWPARLGPTQAVRYRRERWDTPDGDFIDLDWVLPHELASAVGPCTDPPLLVLFHGLEGNASSHYARSTMAAARDRGWDGVVVHFRGCSGEANRLARAYHSGDSDEADWILRRLHRERGAAGRHAPLYVVGISLGGNVLLKWLGERGTDAAFVAAAMAVSAPQDLHAGALRLSRGFNRVYAWHFLGTLKHKSLAKADRYPGLVDRARVAASRDFFDFDDAVTAPLHGFASAMDYWRRSSCRQFLGGIRVPTLVVNALNDPFLPPSALARRREVSPWVRLEYPREGGHVGFASGSPPGRVDWLPRRAMAFFDDPARPGPADAGR